MKKEIIKVHVTRKDIRSGIPTEVTKCPIALALKRLKLQDVYVQHQYGWFLNMAGKAPKIAINFINSFDKKLKVSPISFRLYKFLPT